MCAREGPPATDPGASSIRTGIEETLARHAPVAHASDVIAPSEAHVGRTRRHFSVSLSTLFVVASAIWTLSWVINLLSSGMRNVGGYDLRTAFLPAAHAVLNGASPFPSLVDPTLAHEAAYVYPPFVAFLVAPLTLMPVPVAVGLGVVGSLLLVLLVLWLGGVRDARCYAFALCWAPTFNAVQNVNVSVPIAFCLALAWRYRSAERLSGALVGCAVAAKLFVWPLLLWPVATRRWRGAATGGAIAAVLVLGSWALIGFKGLAGYPVLLRQLSRFEEANSYSVSGVLRAFGVGAGFAHAAAILLTAILCALCLRYGRRGDDARALTAGVLAALASTPILWQHYLMLLLVALAVRRPTLSFGWVLPVALWLVPPVGHGSLIQALLVPVVVAVTGASCLFGRESPPNANGRPVRSAVRTGRSSPVRT